MEHHKFSQSSLERLSNCENDLERVAMLALKYSRHDFGISETLRTVEQQRENVEKGVSKTMKSRHLPNDNGLSEALDIVVYVNGQVSWKPKHYRKVAAAFFRAAFELGVPIEWGGHWESIFDGPHFQLAGGF